VGIFEKKKHEKAITNLEKDEFLDMEGFFVGI